MTAFDRLQAALEAHGGIVKATGVRKLSAQCPAHDDRSPSLSVTGVEGHALLHDWGGCDTGDVLAALNLTLADLYDTRRGAEYRYDNGRTVQRTIDKRFWQKGTDNAPELYRLARVRAAVAEGRSVYVVEGEKDVHALETLDVTATTNPMGATNWSKVDPSPLYGATVVVVADQDEAGRKHAAEVVASLAGHGGTLTVVAAKVGKDAADHVAAGYGLDDFVPAEIPHAPAAEPAPAGADEPRKSAATVLVELAQARYSFGTSTDGEPFAVPLHGEPVARLLRGGKQGLRAELARRYFAEHRKAAPQQALADALLVLEGMAGDADPEVLAQRVANHGGARWLDLGDATGAAVRIDHAGWAVTLPPVRFRRTVLTAALPQPAAGGDLEELWALLNVSKVDRPLLLAWLVAALVPEIPHPVLALFGEQGTGKSTAAKVLTTLLDPSPVPLRKAPRDGDAWVTAAAGSWIVAVDNISTVPDWFSDTLCRAVTGDGDVRRQLYTDAGLALFAFRRAVILTGIDVGATRGDLADRLLVIDLDVIDERARLLDADLEHRWADAHPRILGALLDLAASVASALPYVRLERSPRMADFARILAAVDQVLGTDGFTRYADRSRNLATDSLSADPFVVEMRRQLDEEFTGTSAALLDAIVLEDKRPPKGWPHNAREVTTLLKRQAPVMRRAGWTVRELAAGHDNALRWELRPPDKARKPDSQRSQRSHDEPRASDASVASVECTPTQDDGRTLAVVAEPTGNPHCTVCGKPNLFAPTSIARGICAACVRLVPTAPPQAVAR